LIAQAERVDRDVAAIRAAERAAAVRERRVEPALGRVVDPEIAVGAGDRREAREADAEQARAGLEDQDRDDERERGDEERQPTTQRTQAAADSNRKEGGAPGSI